MILKTFQKRLKALEGKVAQEGSNRISAPSLGKSKRRKAEEIEMEHSGYLIAQDTFYVGNMKDVGRIYQQTVIDTYSKVAFTKLYDRKNALVAADMLKIVSFPSLTAKKFRSCVF